MTTVTTTISMADIDDIVQMAYMHTPGMSEDDEKIFRKGLRDDLEAYLKLEPQDGPDVGVLS